MVDVRSAGDDGLLAIAQAAGVEPSQIVRYARFAQVLVPDEVTRQLREAGCR